MKVISTCWQSVVIIHEDVAFLNVIHNQILYDEGNGWIYSCTETGQLNRN